jgi:cell division protein FtsQ
MITLLVAAIGRKRKEVCSDYIITIKAAEQNFFVDEKDIVKLAAAATDGKIKGKPISEIKMKKIEDLLEDNEWIQDAELWVDNKNVLNITVTEREPVARVFTTTGNTFYIDSTTKRMGLSAKMSARVPVFTGFPEKKIWSSKDSALMMDVKAIASYVKQDTFWNSQVSQLDIVNCGYNCWQFEMIPVVGNHTAKLGNGENIEEKFGRLYRFYKQVLSKTGFDKYPVIDVQYKGQVVASKEKPTGSIDSAQLRKNVEKLLRQSRQAQNDSIGALKPAKQNVSAVAANNTTGTNSVPVKTNNPPKPNGDKPRAVMKNKN